MKLRQGMRFMVKIFTKCGQKIHMFTTKINSIIHYMFVLFPIKCHQKKSKQRHQSNLMALSSFCCRVEIIISYLTLSLKSMWTIKWHILSFKIIKSSIFISKEKNPKRLFNRTTDAFMLESTFSNPNFTIDPTI